MSSPSLSAFQYDLPLASPFRIAYDTVTKSENVLVTATDGDLTGYGEAGPVPTITGESAVACREALGRYLAGPAGDAAFPDPALGLASSVAVETALLDLGARQAGRPLCTHLTGAAPADITSSITIPILDGDELLERVRRHVAAGFSIFKVKAGSGIDDDLRRIEAVRDEVGDAEIRIDPNQGWLAEQARKALPRLEDLGVAVLEQPVARDDLEGHASLVGASDIPIMLDESVFSPDDALRAIEAGACDRINIKIQKTGGLRAALEIADVAARYNVPCMLGCMIESRVAILAAAHVVAAHDNIRWADLDGATFLASDPVHGGPKLEAGVIRLDGSPGLAIDAVDAGPALATHAAASA